MKYTHQRFENKLVEVSSGCILWDGAKKNDGSGLFVVSTCHPRRCTTAQRYAYQFYVGPIPGTETVTAKCGNKLCVYQHHLRLKSRRDVILESIKNGRWIQLKNRNLPPVKCGEDNPNARYTEEFVKQIREERSAGAKLIVIATRHQLPVSSVGFICSKRKGI